MPVRFVMVLFLVSGKTYEVPGSIPDSDWELLVRFRDESLRLKSCKWVVHGLQHNVKIKWNRTDGMEVVTPGRPDASAFAEALHRLRPFILDREPLFYHKAAGVLCRSVDDGNFQGTMRRLADRFSGKDLSDQIKLFSAGIDRSQIPPGQSLDQMLRQFGSSFLQLNSPKALDLWLNAFEFHRDQEKRDEFIRRSGGEPGELALAVFRSMMAGKAEAVLWLAGLVTDIEKGPSTRRTTD